MKQFLMTLAAALFISSAALAQDKKENRKEEMIKHRTERMAKDYNLSDKQKKQLLDLNTKYGDMMRPMHRHGHHGMKGQRPEPPKDDKKMAEKRQEMEATMKAYDAELQKIMTADQFKSYQEDQKKFREKRHKRHHKGE